MQRVTVTKLYLGNTDDPQLALAEPAYLFLQRTEQGVWLGAQGLTCGYDIGFERGHVGYVVTLYTEMADVQQVEYSLKWQ